MIQEHRGGSISVWHDQEALRWEPKEQGRIIPTMSHGYYVVKSLAEIFGPPPWEFTDDSIMQLKAMSAASTLDKDSYTDIINQIKKHKCIRVWSPVWKKDE